MTEKDVNLTTNEDTKSDKERTKEEDGVELKPQAKLIKNDETGLQDERPNTSNIAAKEVEASHIQPPSKVTQKETKVVSNVSSSSKGRARRKRKTTTTGASGDDFVPTAG